MLYASITDKIAKPKAFPTFFKNMNVMMLCTKNKLLTREKSCTYSLIVLNFLFVQTSAKLRNSQIFENYSKTLIQP